jgi:hypothetical protein
MKQIGPEFSVIFDAGRVKFCVFRSAKQSVIAIRNQTLINNLSPRRAVRLLSPARDVDSLTTSLSASGKEG